MTTCTSGVTNIITQQQKLKFYTYPSAPLVPKMHNLILLVTGTY